MNTKHLTRRAKRALKAVRAYPTYDKYDIQTSIVDLIADILHLAGEHGFSGTTILRMAAFHYAAETKEHHGTI